MPFARRCCRAAPTKPANKGGGREGRDLSSGWNWQPTNQGRAGSSVISTNAPAGDRPEDRRPYSAAPSREGAPPEGSEPHQDPHAGRTARGELRARYETSGGGRGS